MDTVDVSVLQNAYEKASELYKSDTSAGTQALIALLGQLRDVSETDEERLKITEQTITSLGDAFASQNQTNQLKALINDSKVFLPRLSKAKAAKLVRSLVDAFLKAEHASASEKIALCNECITWADQERRVYLRQALQVRLVGLFYDAGKECIADDENVKKQRSEYFEKALELANNLLKELRKVDDKLLLVEVHLVESRTYTALGNLQKSRGALTAARTTTSGIYTPPKLQAALDLESGLLHAADDRDFKTAYSYFFESFEQFDANGEEQRARVALKLMLLSKIVLNTPDDVHQLLASKLPAKYAAAHADVRAFVDVARAVSRRSVEDFHAVLSTQRDAFVDSDHFVIRQLERVYDALLESNLLKVLEPFSRVRLVDVARLMRMDQHDVEVRLSRMILDKKVSGVIDQGRGVLTLFEPERSDATYEKAIDIILGMNKIVDTLFEKSKKLN